VRTKHLLGAVFATSFCASSVRAAATDDTTPARVEAAGETITVIAENVPLRDVLDQLREQAAFGLIESSDLLQRPVTIALEGVPWRDGLAKLLRGFRYALAMDPETNRPDRLVILSSEGSGGEEPAAPAGSPASGPTTGGEKGPGRESSLEEATRIAKELMAQREDPLQYALRKAREAAAQAEAARQAAEKEQADRSADGEDAAGPGGDERQRADVAYADALSALGQFQDPQRLDVLAPALGSDSTAVRSTALGALRDGTVSDEAVLDQVKTMVTSDPDPYVQREALEVYVRYGDQSEVLSLVQTLGRTSGPTQDIAVREWLRIEKERADAPLADEQLRQATK
jgi:hypothetical protein